MSVKFTDIVGGLAHQMKWGKKSWDVKVNPFIVDVPLRVRIKIDPFGVTSKGKIQMYNGLTLPFYRLHTYIKRHNII